MKVFNFTCLHDSAHIQAQDSHTLDCTTKGVRVVVVVYFILSRLLLIAFSANLGLLCMPHPGMGPLV